jgi:hypothetical protein
VRRLEKETVKRLQELRDVFKRNPQEARTVIERVLDGKLAFTPIETAEGKRYRVEGRAALDELLQIPADPWPRRRRFPLRFGWLRDADWPTLRRERGPLFGLETRHPKGHEKLVELSDRYQRRDRDLDPDGRSVRIESTRSPLPASVVRAALAPAGRGR